MADEDDNKDLKEGDEPSGDGQPEKDAQQDSDGDQQTIAVEVEEDGEVVEKEFTPEEVKSLKEDRDNYREGLLSQKKKDASLPTPDESEEGQEDDEDETPSLSRQELAENNQDNAVTIATSQYDDLLENWDKVLEHYDPSNVDGIKTSDYLSEIERARESFLKESGSDAPNEGNNNKDSQQQKKNESNASADSSINKGSNKGAGERQKEDSGDDEGGRNILPDNSGGIDEWYSSDDE